MGDVIRLGVNRVSSCITYVKVALRSFVLFHADHESFESRIEKVQRLLKKFQLQKAATSSRKR